MWSTTLVYHVSHVHALGTFCSLTFQLLWGQRDCTSCPVHSRSALQGAGTGFLWPKLAAKWRCTHSSFINAAMPRKGRLLSELVTERECVCWHICGHSGWCSLLYAVDNMVANMLFPQSICNLIHLFVECIDDYHGPLSAEAELHLMHFCNAFYELSLICCIDIFVSDN